MPFSYVELEQFYEGLVGRARSRGIGCAITSGMACVAFGVSETTRDCDLLCQPESAEELLRLLGEMPLGEHLPVYRGNLSAPLDARWFRGGWTSHFVWAPADSGAYLDVFGVAPRSSSPWENEIQGFYASPNTVAEMKRTNRDKDWPFVTALGAKMIEKGDERGWLHIYDEELLRTFAESTKQPTALLKRRPVLKLAANHDPSLRAALRAEVEYWQELDRVRLKIYEKAVRPYMVEMRKMHLSKDAGLSAQHDLRVRCAEKFLPINPLRDYGVGRMISEAREAVAQNHNSRRHGVVAKRPRSLYIVGSMKKPGKQRKLYTPAVRRRLRKAIYDFHIRAFGEEMARVNHLPLAARRRYIGEMVDHATRKGVKSRKPALGVTP